MFRKHKWFLLAPDGGENGGGGGGGFDAAAARGFLQSYGHAETALKGMPDPDVMKLAEPIYKTHTESLSKTTQEAITKAKGEWGKTPPENWRELSAGGDEKRLEQLKRFTSYDAYSKAFFDAQETIRTGSHKKGAAFPDKGTADEQAAWRKEAGIPDKPDGYEVKLDGGIVIGEHDKPIVDAFLKNAHSKNMQPGAVKDAMQWYFGEHMPTLVKQEQDAQAKALQETKKALMTSWGSDYEPNRNSFVALLDSRVKGDSKMKQLVVNAFDTDPEFAELMAGMAREINPVHTTAGGSGDMPQAVQDELAKLNKMMGDHNSAYWKGAEAEKNQARYRDLVDWEERRKKK